MENKLYGIDVSAWQPDSVSNAVQGDFVIVKATEGITYVSAKMAAQIDGAVKTGKLAGLYHFTGGGDAKAEAVCFIGRVKPYIGKSVLILDYEGVATNKGREWCRTWMQEVKRLTGVRPWLYSYYAVAKAQQLPELCKELGAGFWLAQYWNTNQISGYNPQAQGPALACDCWQYTSNGLIPGYPDRLDCNVFYGDRSAWLAYATGNTAVMAPSTPTLIVPPATYSLPKKAGMAHDEVGYLQAAIGTKVDYDWGPDSERKYNAWRPVNVPGRIRRDAATEYETKWVQYITGAAIDGKWQDKTDKAVKARQKASGLNPDGWIGPKTLTAWGYR